MISLLDSLKASRSWQTSIGGTLGSIAGMIGKISSYRSNAAAVKNQKLVSDIALTHGSVKFLKNRSAMIDSAIGEYGKALVAGARAGGVMPSYYGKIWKVLVDGVNDANEDYQAIQIRHSMERASFASQRAALRMKFIEKLTDEIISSDWMRGSRSKLVDGRNFR